MAFSPLWPRDLELPDATVRRRHRPVFDAGRNSWLVRSPQGEVVGEPLNDRDAAQKLAAALDAESATDAAAAAASGGAKLATVAEVARVARLRAAAPKARRGRPRKPVRHGEPSPSSPEPPLAA